MRILHIINSLGKGGAEKLLVESLPIIKNHTICVLALTNKDEATSYKIQLQSAKIQYFLLHNGSVRSSIVIWKLYKFLKEKITEFDIIHVHLFPTLYYVSICSVFFRQRRRVKWIFTEHSTQNKRAGNVFLRPIEKWIYQNYDAVIAISAKVQDRLKKLLPNKDKIHLIRNGVNIERFKLAPLLTSEEINEKFGVNAQPIILLMTARFKYPKDQATLIKSLAFLPLNVHAFFVGDGDNNQMEAAISLAKSEGLLDRVHFLGFRSDVPLLMKAADINILSSNYEGMSGVALESMASGTPFLGSDVPGINDVVPDDRFLFKVGEARQLSDRIKNILRSHELAEQMSVAGLNYVNQFAMEKMVNNYLNLYTELFSKK